MSTEPKPVPTEPAAPEPGLFPLLDGYWEALRQGAGPDVEGWVRSHPEAERTLSQTSQFWGDRE